MEVCTEKQNYGEREKCCAKCKYFEERTGFCRYNPPIPVVTHRDDGSLCVTSVYSKINMPGIDWCQKFDLNIDKAS
jgi:hypothetical protein